MTESILSDSSPGVRLDRDPDWQRWIAESAVIEPETVAPQPTKLGAVRRWFGRVVNTLFCLASLVGLLAFVTAIPVLQLLSLGYLLLVAGRLASGGTIRHALPGLAIAGRLGMAVVALGIMSLPIGLIAHWASVADIIDPGSAQSAWLRLAALMAGLAGTFYLGWAWVRGGRLWQYLWPEPKRLIADGWRWSTWSVASERLWSLALSLQLPRLFWLGLRGLVCTLVWLAPGMLIMGVTRNGDGDAVGPVVVLCLLVLGFVMQYLPMLQTHFAAENHWRAMFAWRHIRRDFAAAPWSWAAAMLVGLVLMPIPLYLLKIEATPQEITWLPCLVFVAFMLPARIAEGLALRRCRRLRAVATQRLEAGEPAIDGRWRSRWATVSKWLVRLIVMPAIVITYMSVLTASQFTSWDGVQTWIAQHALLVPVPFVGV